jgi:hypothetical protein
MQKLMKPFWQFSEWYDYKCKEPWRMLLFLLISQPLCFSIASIHSWNKNFPLTLLKNFPLTLLLVAYYFLFFTFLINRIIRQPMLHEINQVQKWFMDKQGVTRIEELKIKPGDYEIPIGGSNKLFNVRIGEHGSIHIGGLVKEKR